jgi:hypothetical protein
MPYVKDFLRVVFCHANIKYLPGQYTYRTVPGTVHEIVGMYKSIKIFIESIWLFHSLNENGDRNTRSA